MARRLEMRAATRGYADLSGFSLDEGAGVSTQRNDAFTALIVAVFFGHEDVSPLTLMPPNP